jgi:hypothetical protein
VLQVPVLTELQAQPALLVHWERQVLPALALTEQVELRAQPVLKALQVQALLVPLVLRGRQVLLAHPAQSGLPAQVPLVLRESALLALQVQLAYKEQRALVLTVPQVPRALQELPEPPDLLVPQVLARLAL